ncbi:hypothetical protein IU427_30110 [Nocardia beijingensis]|uniref:hypothetical protein n=1 Tax=Nocardia beijingensis TaxID=95162 RepID=UPI001893F182|nr:hypothetical protein [Nocardia beijingensis]MBF6469390.1 hypothetical protein [Nocardia beijingensis]
MAAWMILRAIDALALSCGWTPPCTRSGRGLTDEDAFDTVEADGIAIVVRSEETGARYTAARFSLARPLQVRAFLRRLAQLWRGETAACAPETWTRTFHHRAPALPAAQTRRDRTGDHHHRRAGRQPHLPDPGLSACAPSTKNGSDTTATHPRNRPGPPRLLSPTP